MSDSTYNTCVKVSTRYSLFLIVVFFSLAIPNFSQAFTAVTQDISTDTTWTTEQSPYHISENISIATGTSLIIEPGVVVKFSDSQGLTIRGSLSVVGTSDLPIYFTSIHDDSVGGDSNGNGSTTAPGTSRKSSIGNIPTRWGSIIFEAESTGNLDNVIVRYSGYDRRVTPLPAIYNIGGNVQISNGHIDDNGYFGIGQLSGSLSLSDSILEDQQVGVSIKDGDVSITRNNFSDINGFGLMLDGSGDISFTENTFNGGHIAVTLWLSGSRKLTHYGNSASDNYINGILLEGPVLADTELSGGDLPYVISAVGGSDAGTGDLSFPNQHDLTVGTDISLTFLNQAVVKLEDDATLDVMGTLNLIGKQDQPIIVTSLYDNSLGGVVWDQSGSNSPSVNRWGHISIAPDASVNLNYVELHYGGDSRFNSSSVIFNQGGLLDIENSVFKNNLSYGIRHQGGTTNVFNTVLEGHSTYGIFNETDTEINAVNNYWGDSSGPRHATLNPQGLGDAVSDNVAFIPWLDALPGTEPECCSSVLFLPGIMGTELFEGADKRWEPEGESDVERLFLDETGKSLNDITIGDVIDTFDGPAIFSADLYKSFLNDLEVKKQEDFIDDYDAYGYDWRLSLSDILASGELENRIRELATASKSKKVTIVAHSNGGLLAKALVNELGGEAAGLVDQIILVGVPQLGTPQAIGSLLHGYDSGIPTFYSDAQARDFAFNSPFTYNLLPHDSYSNNAGVSVSTPLVTFDNGEATQVFVDTYGSEIYSGNQLREFLAGTDGRTSPDYDDLVNPSKANNALLQAAVSQQTSVGHLWQAPEGVKVYQIAGVGELTVAGIEYQTINLCLSVVNGATGWYCNTGTKTLGYKPIRVLDGDATVVEPSALAMQEDENVKRWWIDLKEYNKILFGQVTKPIFRTEHKDLLEISEVRNLIWNNLIGTSTAMDYQFISANKPGLGLDKRLTFTLHSPLSLSYNENDGTVVDESSPYGRYSQYKRYGEVQIIDIYNDEEGTIVMQGEKTGSFTLEVEESDGEEITSTITYAGIPSSTSTVASIEVGGTNIDDTASLQVDYDGDGETDFMLESAVDETVALPDEPPSEPTVEELESQFKTYVNDNLTNKSVKKSLVRQIDQFYKQYQQQEKLKSKSPFFAKLFQNNFMLRLRLQALERQIDLYASWNRVPIETSEELNRLISLMINKL
ncbi:hypothetical protein COU14_01580 [Candidatus Kaiserbacteria bacterium CG10_big_fil_rev_8_21_14_0_10_44_10]|uniref:Right handed beta helix domain-containing protein n=1 Tax=Candidatus Kaiserbacteria bacterium CG10_big_fil_rev_8_21_14_0_10_44_10 TaxID=1974606 RepID=A0A2H0UHR1_9BACT|nr:MAG: hypothetical protein COU14_01580 [Candidatus Kaiserbacteria bacterium CG10_big_fil_rev_8_21_14_0_10_44_10]